MWCWLWCRLSQSLWWRCTCAFAPPVCLGMLCCAILARKAAIRLSILKNSRVSSHRSFTLFRPGDSTHRFFSSRTLSWGFWIWYCMSSIAPPENAPLAILAIFKATRVSDSYSWTWPPSLAINAAMLKTYKKLVAASDLAITSTIYASVAYTTPKPVSFTLWMAYH